MSSPSGVWGGAQAKIKFYPFSDIKYGSFSSSEKLVVVSQRADSLCTASIKLVELNNDIVQFNENTKDTFTMT